MLLKIIAGAITCIVFLCIGLMFFGTICEKAWGDNEEEL